MDIRFFAHRIDATAARSAGIACEPNVRESEKQKKVRVELESAVEQFEGTINHYTGGLASELKVDKSLARFANLIVRIVGNDTGPYNEYLDVLYKTDPYSRKMVFKLKKIIPKVVALVK